MLLGKIRGNMNTVRPERSAAPRQPNGFITENAAYSDSLPSGDSDKAAKLVAILQETPGRLVTYPQLIERLWPGIDYPLDHGHHHLHELAHRTRGAIEDLTGVIDAIAAIPGRGHLWTREGADETLQ